MDRYDQVVIGSGVSGLTASVLLAQGGNKVLLLEKGPAVGGSLARFYREGIPFDTGFHFTGGFADGGLLHDMSKVVGIQDSIVPIFLDEEQAHQFIFEEDKRSYEFAFGFPRLPDRLKGYFPADAAGIDRYFEMVHSVCDRTSAMDLGAVLTSNPVIDEDFVSLQSVLDDLVDSAHLKALLCGFCMCYGVKPTEISFANHSRICCGLYESVARVQGGGDAFIKAYLRKLDELDVEIRCGRHVVECADIREERAHRFILNTGEEVEFEGCVFTINPKEILKVLPREMLSPAFISRVTDLESTNGFFTVFGVLDGDVDPESAGQAIMSLFPSTDVNEMLDSDHDGDSALVIISTLEEVREEMVKTLIAFEPSFMTDVVEWEDTRTGERPPEYLEYKKARASRIQERMSAVHEGGTGRFRMLDSASVLTFRDYLHSPDGSAYGAKQKIGQINLLGKLPVRNMYAAGQSAILPGVMGAMISSFFVARAILGKETFSSILERRMDR